MKRNYYLVVSFLVIFSLSVFGQDLIYTKDEYIKLLKSDSELTSLQNSQQSLSDKANTLGVIAILGAGLTGLSGVLHYEANGETSKALTSLPFRIFGTLTILTGVLGTIEYFFAKDKERKIEQLLYTKHNIKLDWTYTSSNIQFGLGMIYSF